jgi:hypothetical protein
MCEARTKNLSTGESWLLWILAFLVFARFADFLAGVMALVIIVVVEVGLFCLGSLLVSETRYGSGRVAAGLGGLLFCCLYTWGCLLFFSEPPDAIPWEAGPMAITFATGFLPVAGGFTWEYIQERRRLHE